MKPRSLAAEAIGTALLVFFGVGTATVSFGIRLTGASTSAGVITTAFAFGLVLLALVYAIGPISGCHVNPAVTIGFLTAGRITILDAVGYWIAQLVGGIVGAAVLAGVVRLSTRYRPSMGLGADGFGSASMIGLNWAGALIVEGIFTFVFVLVILVVTRTQATANISGLVIGFTLALVHIVGIPLTGLSVNPARSLGPAIFAGGGALGQVWVFFVGPLVGGVVAALVSRVFYPAGEDDAAVEPAPQVQPPPL